MRTFLFLAVFFAAPAAYAQSLTVAGGSTVRAGTTKHDAYRLEVNFPWKPDLWHADTVSLSLNHALSIVSFRDRNNVNAISWAPNLILAPRRTSGFYPYAQISFGVAYLSDDTFESDPPLRYRFNGAIYYDDGTSDMGSHGQFESSIALGLVKNRVSIRARYYHYSNAGISGENGGMDVEEIGLTYSF